MCKSFFRPLSIEILVKSTLSVGITIVTLRAVQPILSHALVHFQNCPSVALSHILALVEPAAPNEDGVVTLTLPDIAIAVSLVHIHVRVGAGSLDHFEVDSS